MKRKPVVHMLRFGAGPVAGLLIFLLLHNHEPQQRWIGAIFGMTVAMWIAEALPLGITAMLAMAFLTLVAGVKEKEAFAGLADPIIPLFIGSLMLAKAMEVTGLSRRFAWSILRRPWATRSPARLLLVIASITCAVSLLLSNTATTAMMLPIGLSILATLGVGDRASPYGIALLLSLTFGSSVAVGTPIGTPPNLIAVGMIRDTTGVSLGFADWMVFGMPITILMTLGAWGVLWALFGRNAPDAAPAHSIARERFQQLGPLTESERNTLVVLFVALVLWLAPDLAEPLLSSSRPDVAAWLKTHLTTAVSAVIVVALLFILPARDTEDGRTISWKQAGAIDWGIILLFAGGISLGQAMFSSGLAKDLGESIAAAVGANSLWTITALAIAAAILLSEIANNTASATTLLPVVIGLSAGAGVSPVAPALGVALGASLGFMLPVSTPPNVIVHSSGLIPQHQIIRAGFLVDILGFIVTFAVLRIALPLMGLA